MTRPRLAPALSLLLLVPAIASAQATVARAPSQVARVDSVFARWDSHRTPGCAVAIRRDGTPLLVRAYGMADLEHDAPNLPETVFETGSVSKQFTAAAVVLLAQQGKLSLDDDVRKHVPELPDYGATITLRHLVNHTSGLRDWGTVVAIAGWPRTSRVHTHAHVLDVASRQKSLNYAPGSQYLYSNTGYNLLAVIVERVSGEPFAAFTRRAIFQPLGMTRTEWRDDFTRVVKGRAIAYEQREDSTFHSQMPFENVHGNGGLLTTVTDLLRWNENLRTGRVGGRALIDELNRQGVLADGRKIEYAGGLFVSRHRGLPEVSHSGATAGYRAWLGTYPEQRLEVALLCNAAEANPVVLAHQVADIYLPASAPPAAPRPVAMPAEMLEARAGLYRNRRTNEPYRLVVRDGRLGRPGSSGLTPVSAARFEGPDGWPRMEFEGPGHVPFRFTGADGDTLSYEPMEAWTPTPEQLAALAGEYRSEEAEATYTVAVVDGKPVMRMRPAAAIPMVPAYADAFTVGGMVVRFGRDAAGRVDGFSVWADRVRGLRFDRVSR
ncbi:MAG TPA: serine hydrolase domain-containing protein [Longimicrobium sp.]|nr:serine hydrolase domain-containing protein [Longimicrobium sp.]